MYMYVFTMGRRRRRRRRRRKEENDELLAHMQASKRALCVNVTVKKAITARSEERKALFSLLALHMYVCNDVIVALLPCLLQRLAAEQINIFYCFFLSFFFLRVAALPLSLSRARAFDPDAYVQNTYRTETALIILLPRRCSPMTLSCHSALRKGTFSFSPSIQCSSTTGVTETI